MSEDIRGQDIGEIETGTLVRAITIEAEEFTDTFLANARTELASRGVDVSSLIEHVTVVAPEGETETTADGAIAAIADMEPWTFRVLRTATGESVVINTMAGCASVTYRDETGVAVGVLAFRDPGVIGELVRPLLRLDPSWRLTAGRFEDEKWEVLTTSNSIEHLIAVGEELAEASLVYTLRTASARELEASAWMSVRHDGAQLLVRPDDASRAARVMKAIDEEIERTFTDAERHAEAGNAEGELACYDRLARLRPDDGMVHFNRAAILLDLSRHEEAADAFMEAVPILARDEALRRYLADVAGHLRALLESYPKPNVVRHTLAMIAVRSDEIDVAREQYERILAEDAGDAAAHAALGRILYEGGEHDADAASHLASYLELEPDAPDREGVEEALAALRAGE